MQARDIPNLITWTRMYTAPPIVALLALLGWLWALVFVALVYAGSDFLDGYLAKKFRWESEWGRRNDPIADKALFWPITFVILTWNNFPVLLVVPSLAYFAYDLGGEYIRRQYISAGRPMEAPNWFARKKTFIQMGSIFSMLLESVIVGENASILFSFGQSLFWIGVGFAAVSGYIYMMRASSAGLIRIPVMPAIF